MKQVGSTVFRVTYTTISEPVEVTVDGTVIGEWTPRASNTVTEFPVAEQKEPDTSFIRPQGQGTHPDRGDRFGSPKPAPKSRSK